MRDESREIFGLPARSTKSAQDPVEFDVPLDDQISFFYSVEGDLRSTSPIAKTQSCSEVLGYRLITSLCLDISSGLSGREMEP